MKLIDLSGKRFGKLTVLSRDINQGGHTKWLCQCDCGKTKVIQGNHLQEGSTTSCGNCYESKTSRLYKSVWNKLFQRCYNSKNKDYKNYGGRGVRVCPEWHNYLVFKEWAYANGYDESSEYGQCTLDRKDVNGDYSPDNCRFITIAEQNLNKTNNHYVTHNGETHTISEWAIITNISASALYSRINRGWDLERAFTQPTRKRGDL